jgi:prepilin-type N-terminal cleavage/methylation domain-containing protein
MPRRPVIRRGFTLIELLVVVAVTAVMMAILLPSLASSRAQARRAVCGANLHALGIGYNLYLDVNDGRAPLYAAAQASPLGQLWWFGFEANGPGSGTYRPLDPSLAPLAPFTAEFATRIQCPDFPYDDGAFFPKFARHAASYGMNLKLSGTQPRKVYLDRQPWVLTFADGVHFDFGTSFNEAHYIAAANVPTPSGYVHFRHRNEGQYVLLDGHVESQRLTGAAYPVKPGGLSAGKLVSDGAGDAIYGF